MLVGPQCKTGIQFIWIQTVLDSIHLFNLSEYSLPWIQFIWIQTVLDSIHASRLMLKRNGSLRWSLYPIHSVTHTDIWQIFANPKVIHPGYKLNVFLKVFGFIRKIILSYGNRYQVGNTSCRKITEVKQLRTQLALGLVTNPVLKWILMLKIM